MINLNCYIIESILETPEIFCNTTATLATTVVNQVLEVINPEFLSLSVYDFNGKNVLNSTRKINQVEFLTPGVYLGVITTNMDKGFLQNSLKNKT